MPKRPRQSHVPQQPRRRRGRRPGAGISEDQLYAPAPATSVAPGVTADVVARPGPARPSGRPTATSRAIAALPVYDRAFILSEVRRIAALSGSLLALIVVLAVLLR
jgi:hypothetical protein